MRFRRCILFLALVGVVPACGDDDASAGGAGPADAMVPIEDTDSAVSGDVAVIPMVMDAAVSPPSRYDDVSRIVVTVEPRRALYELGAEIAASAVAKDRFDDPVGDVEFDWNVAPPGIAEVDEGGRMTIVGEGQGTISACLDELCGRASFFVDAGPPTLVVDAPLRGAMLGGDAVGGIEVSGRAEDSSGTVDVWVNGARAELAEDGRFSIVVPARFGVNRIQVIADDGVRRPAVEDVRYVLWAPRYLPVDDDKATVETAVVVRVDQALLDGGEMNAVPEGAGEVAMGDLAELIRFFVQLADVRGLLGDPVLVDNPPNMRLSFDAVELNTPEVELNFVAGGIELFVRLPELVVRTSGFMSLEGQNVSLNGTIRSSLAAFARLDMTVDDGLQVTVQSNGVALEGVDGEFESDAVRALVNSLASVLGDTVHGGLFQIVDRLMRERMPGLIQSALGAVESAIGRVPLSLDPGVGQPVNLVLEVTPRGADVRRRTALRMVFDASVSGEGIAPREGDRGIALLSDATPPAGWGEGVGASLRLETLNALLHEVWRTGAMTVSPDLPERYQLLVESIAIDAQLPPLIAPAPVSAALPLVLQMGGLRVRTTPVGGEGVDEYVIALEVGVGVNARETTLTLEIADDPVVSATLLTEGSGNALPADLFVGLIDSVVWPLVQGFVAESTALEFEEIALPAEALAQYTPRLEAVSVVPVFTDARQVVDGRLTLEGAVEIRVAVGSP